MALGMGRAMGGKSDRVANGLPVRIDAYLDAVLALEIDALAQDGAAVVLMPGHAPGGLVEMGMRIDETGNGDGAMAVLDRHAGICLEAADAGDPPVADQDIGIFTAMGANVAEQQTGHALTSVSD